MPELRKDPVVGRWVIIATERARRPVEYQPDRAQPRAGGFCPFCPGHEDKTPREVLAYHRAPLVAAPSSTGATSSLQPAAPEPPREWTLRVVPNKFPALMIEGSLDRAGEGLYDKMNGIGAHEVVIETPHHDATFAQLSPQEIESVLWAFRDRICDLKRDTRFRYVMVFKNHGLSAGATLEHSHSQLIALPVVPVNIAEEMAGARRHFENKERCIYCDIVRQELADGRRVIFENEGFVALAPYAPKFPFETWVLPKHHGAHFEDAQREQFAQLADALRVTLRKLNIALDDPPYNFILHTAPFAEREVPYYHWHFQIMPTLTKVAGFEWGTGFYINPVSPEKATEYLRTAE
jgi:UDPglucose--hexose-1-phosphate uridylyltransferase